MLKAFLTSKSKGYAGYEQAGEDFPATPNSHKSDSTVASEGGTKSESQMLVRVAVLLIDELRMRLRRCFEHEWLIKIGVAWGDNPLCGECFCTLHRSAISECKELTQLERHMLLQGHIAGLPIRSLFTLLLSVVTNRQRRIDGQPRYLSQVNARDPRPVSAMKRPYGVNHWSPPETGSIDATRACQELMGIHRDFFHLWNEYKRTTTKLLPSTEEREAALNALARSSTMRFNAAAAKTLPHSASSFARNAAKTMHDSSWSFSSVAAKTMQSTASGWSFKTPEQNLSLLTLRPQSSFLSKDSCGNSPLASATRHRDASAGDGLAPNDPRVLARSEDYLSDLFERAVRCLRWLGPLPTRSLALSISWAEFRSRPLEHLISERAVSRECHACLSGLTMRNDPYRERLHKTQNQKRMLMAGPVGMVIAAKRVTDYSRHALKTSSTSGGDAAEESKIYRQGLRNARRSSTLYAGAVDEDDVNFNVLET